MRIPTIPRLLLYSGIVGIGVMLLLLALKFWRSDLIRFGTRYFTLLVRGGAHTVAARLTALEDADGRLAEGARVLRLCRRLSKDLASLAAEARAGRDASQRVELFLEAIVSGLPHALAPGSDRLYRCAVLVPDVSGEYLVVRAGSGYSADGQLGLRLRMDGCLQGYAHLNGIDCYSGDIERHADWNGLALASGGYEVVFCAPIRAGRAVLGVLSLERAGPGISFDVREHCSTLAAFAAIALSFEDV